ncbi:putative bifunctional diguanylate cyclase/phosphodiesterase [Gordoniibacillus kamchatkensis]|uniref:putative bifunctional diguanylate cyclase/phosphodiesterase n=1 Tax=Gordoniibacillus kamchatkensis TaxID=1590651 RepID=UPI000698A0B2|nr:EAL domain-containing protein [Paenibacillus sp. VKM B-2647]
MNDSIKPSSQRREHGYAALFELHPHAVFELNTSGICLQANRAAQELTGYNRDDIEGRSLFAALDEEARDSFAEALLTASGGASVQLEAAMTRRCGRIVELHVTLMPAHDAPGCGVFAIAQDVTERRNNERTIHHMAYHDYLTELPNRRLFQQRLASLLDDIRAGRHAAATPDTLAVLLIDLDGFKTVNDTLGHAIGDETIRYAAKRLKRCIREEDLAARIGGDEFVVILCNLHTTQQAAEIAERITRELSKPFHVHGHSASLSASVGIALYPSDGQDADSLLRTADAAMYRVKERGKNNFAFAVGRYEPIASSSLLGMREALAKEHFFLHYEPLVDAASNRPIGFEAMPRWRPEDGRLLLPDQFMPLAEANGFSDELSDWMLHAACNQLLRWQHDWGLPLRLGINMSLRQLCRDDCSERILSVLHQLRFSPALLSVEICESELVSESEWADKPLQTLTNAGVELTIDDFGSGFSSLRYLRQLAAHTIKLDRSLTRHLSGEMEKAIVSALVHLADKLALTLIVKGVETKEQRDALAALGCRFMQGALFGMPQPADRFPDAEWALANKQARSQLG